MAYEGLIQPALWMLAAGVAAILFVRGALVVRKAGRATAKKPLLYAAAVSAVALMVVPSVGVVPAGHRGVVYDVMGGVQTAERGEGVTLLVPWLQHMRVLSVRTQKAFSDKVYAQSLDLQEITVVASVNYHVDPALAAELYRNVGLDYNNVAIQPALFQRTKAAVGHVRAENFASTRGELAATIQRQLSVQLGQYGIIVEWVNIEDAIFDKDFIAAVKAKVIAEQVAEEQKRLIEAEAAKKAQAIIQAKARARSVAIEAAAQAWANERLAASLTPRLLRWRWLTTWDGKLPVVLAGPSAMLLIDGRQLGEEEEVPLEDFGP